MGQFGYEVPDTPTRGAGGKLKVADIHTEKALSWTE